MENKENVDLSPKNQETFAVCHEDDYRLFLGRHIGGKGFFGHVINKGFFESMTMDERKEYISHCAKKTGKHLVELYNKTNDISYIL